MKKQTAVRNFYVLPSCLLLLNLGVELVNYKTREVADPFVRTAAIMGMVLFGGSFVGFVLAPAITTVVGHLHRGSREHGGTVGEILFLAGLGALIFWLYYLVYIIGPEAVLPREWWNPKV